MDVIVVGLLLAVIVGVVAALWLVERRGHAATRDRFRPVLDVEAERARVLIDIQSVKQGLELAQSQFESERTRAEQERARVGVEFETDMRAKRARWKGDYQLALDELARLTREVGALTDEAELQSIGYYRPKFDFRTSDDYKRKLEIITAQQVNLLKEKKAASCPTQWQIECSRAKRKQVHGAEFEADAEGIQR